MKKLLKKIEKNDGEMDRTRRTAFKVAVEAALIDHKIYSPVSKTILDEIVALKDADPVSHFKA